MEQFLFYFLLYRKLIVFILINDLTFMDEKSSNFENTFLVHRPIKLLFHVNQKLFFLSAKNKKPKVRTYQPNTIISAQSDG